MNIAIIPARGGSVRVPRKNVRAFYGKPIIAYSIEAARATGLFQKILVSTEDKDIADVAKAYGAKIHMRARPLAQGDIGTQEVTRAVLRWWLADPKAERPDFACCIYATAPLMSIMDIYRGYGTMLALPGVAFAYSVHAETGADAGQFYWGRTQAFIDRVPLDADRGKVQRIPIEGRLVCDINTEDDWQRAEIMYADLQEEINRERNQQR